MSSFLDAPEISSFELDRSVEAETPMGSVEYQGNTYLIGGNFMHSISKYIGVYSNTWQYFICHALY